MSFFKVEFCDQKGCLSWRFGNTCVKDGMNIKRTYKYVLNSHDEKICQIRKQVNIYRLEKLIEE